MPWRPRRPCARLTSIANSNAVRKPYPAVVLHLAGEAWKLDAKGKQLALEEGMSLDEHEGG